MIFNFKNLGTIKEADIELGNLTVLCGKNNTGKTYLSYAVYGFLENWNTYFNDYKFKYLDSKSLENQLFNSKEDVEIDLHIIRNELDNFTNFASSIYLKKDIERVFSSSEIVRKNTIFNFHIDLDFEKEWKYDFSLFSFYKPKNSNLLIISKKKFDNEVITKKGKSENDNISNFVIGVLLIILLIALVAYAANSKKENGTAPKIKKENSLIKIFLEEVIKNQLFGNIFYICAERNSIQFFQKELDKTRSELIKENKFRELEQIVSNVASPIISNIDFARSLSSIENEKSFLFNSFPSIIHHIEKEILDIEIALIGGEPKVKIKDNYISYHLASTSIRALSDLHWILKHKVQQGNLLIIDEPELNLHPENQIKLARLFVKLVNAGVKVWITTHSDYIIKEINNCLMLGSDFEGKQKLMKKYDYQKDEILQKEDLRVYIAENHTVRRVEVDEYGMKESSFDDTLNYINNVSDDFTTAIYNQTKTPVNQ